MVPRPRPATPESVMAGRKLYGTFCAACHGKEGAGDGPGAANLEPRPANFTDAMMMAHEEDSELFWKIGEGRRLMPPWKDTLSEADRWSLVDFIRTLPKESVPGMETMPGHHEHEAKPHGHAEGEESGHGHGHAERPEPRRKAPTRSHRDRPGAPPHTH